MCGAGGSAVALTIKAARPAVLISAG